MQLPAHDHPVILDYVLNQIRLIQQEIPLHSETRLLEVGCGNGYFTVQFEKICKVTGIDISQWMLSQNPVKTTHLMDARKMDFPDNSFDIVFCHETLHHMEDYQAVMREIYRVTKQHLVIIEPNNANPLLFLLGLLMSSERQSLKFSLRYVRNIAVNHGFQVLKAYSYGLMIPAATPVWMLPFARGFNFKQPFGWENFVFAQKI